VTYQGVLNICLTAHASSRMKDYSKTKKMSCETSHTKLSCENSHTK